MNTLAKLSTTSLLFLTLFAFLSCQAGPTKSDLGPGGAKHGFLPPPLLNESMQNLKRDLIILQPYIFDKKKFNDDQNKAFLKKSIHDLSVNSQNVKHDPVLRDKDPTVRFVAKQFASEIQEADVNFKNGFREYARSQLTKVTSYCLECHTRLKDGIEVRLQDSVEPYVNSLSVKDQIEFMIAFRQYDSAFKIALQEVKNTLSSREDLEEITRLGFLVSVRYMQDKGKAEALSTALKMNAKVASFLKDKNMAWKKSLDAWNSNKTLLTLLDIRSLLKTAASEIEDMITIPALLRLLTNDLSNDELGEALLLTGESYENLSGISILTLHENYFESCINRVPHSRWSKQCYKRYEDSIVANYTGSAGTRVPHSVRAKLNSLKLLAN